MDIMNDLYELKETVGNKIADANQRIKKSGGELSSSDVEMIDKLTHSMKSLVTTCAMLEAEDDYSEDDGMGYGYGNSYARRNYRNSYAREGRNGMSGNGGSYARRNSSRYSRNGYSRGMEWNEQLRQMMDEAPDEATRMDIKRLMDRMGN